MKINSRSRIIRVMLITCICLFICAFQCKKGMGGLDFRLVIKNNSKDSIYFDWSKSYPNIEIDAYNITRDPLHNKLSPGANIPIYLRDDWERVVAKIPEEKLIFFFFDAKILETTDWDTVRANGMYLSKKILTLDSIKKMNWTVSYP